MSMPGPWNDPQPEGLGAKVKRLEAENERLRATPRLVEATINEDTGVRTVIFETARGRHTFTIADAPDEVWKALSSGHKNEEPS